MEKSLIACISGEVDNGLKAVINPKPAACHAIGSEKQNPSLVSNAADNKSNMAECDSISPKSQVIFTL